VRVMQFALLSPLADAAVFRRDNFRRHRPARRRIPRSGTLAAVDHLRLSAEAALRRRRDFWHSLSRLGARGRAPRHASSRDHRFRGEPPNRQNEHHATLFRGHTTPIRSAFHRRDPISRSGWVRLACSTLARFTRHPCRSP
jgi:hypothetical protein